jgi:hypothetical protein
MNQNGNRYILTFIKLDSMTYKLIYANFQVWYFPSRQLALWKKKQLIATGNYSREFKIETV